MIRKPGSEALKELKDLEEEIIRCRERETALREQEEKYRTLFDNAADLIAVVDTEGRLLDLNKKFEDEIGRSREEMLGKNAFRCGVMTETSAAKASVFLKEVVESKTSPIFEIEGIQKDGRLVPYEVRAVPIKKGGRIAAVQAILRNLSARKRAEEALRESEAKYRDLIERSNDGIAIVQDDRLKFVNGRLAQMLGYSVEETVDTPFTKYLAPGEVSKVVDRYNRRMAGEKLASRYETILRHRNGKEVEVELNGGIINYEGKAANLAFVRDITEKKTAEKFLRESEEKYRLVVENAIEGILITQDMRILFTNKKLCDFLGYSKEELIAHPNPFEIIHPDDRELVLKNHVKRLKGEDAPEIYSFRVLNKDGGIIWVDASGVRISWKERPAILNFFNDISERKRAEEEKARLHIQLQQAQKMEALGNLAGGIAHDFNNLLMGIAGNASLMLMDTSPNHPHHEMLKNIEKQVQSGAKLTRQLLGYARKGRYEVKAIDLNHVLKDTLGSFSRTRKDINIHFELAPDLHPIEADSSQLEQVLLNLYVNAADAMPGGGDLFLTTSNVSHEAMKGAPYAPKQGRYVMLKVTDTGIGMDAKTLERIFDPFSPQREMGRGTGLGLASVYGIIKGHGGYIDVESEKGRGATFKIYLPASALRPYETVPSPGRIIEGTETILVVDDEPVILEIAARLLEKLRYTVLEAKSGKEAVECYMENRHKIDLVILDTVMPGMSGGEVYDQLRKIDPNVKVLLSSGYSRDFQANEILKRGCNGFIQKPFNFEELSSHIRAILGERQES